MPFTGIVALASLLIGAIGWSQAMLEGAAERRALRLPAVEVAYAQAAPQLSEGLSGEKAGGFHTHAADRLDFTPVHW